MKTIYGTKDVEINGVQQIAAGGTSATTVTGALFNLGIHPSQIIYSSGNLIGNQVISGQLTSSFSNGDVQIPLGFSNYAFVRNLDSNLSKGEAVYIAGAQGDRAAVRKAANTGEATSSKTFGIAAHPISAGSDGYVITNGSLQNLNILTSYNIGDSLWLGPTNGSITNIKPTAPNHSVFLGVVEKPGNGNNGIMYVKVQNGVELDEVHDVLIQNPVSGQFIVRDNDNLWKNKTATISDIQNLQSTLDEKISPLLFSHSSFSYQVGSILRYFSQIFDLALAANSSERNFRVPHSIVIKSAIFTYYNGGANAAVNHSGATLRIRNKTDNITHDILTYNLNGIGNAGIGNFSASNLNITLSPSKDYVIEVETGTFTTAPSSTRHTLSLYY